MGLLDRLKKKKQSEVGPSTQQVSVTVGPKLIPPQGGSSTAPPKQKQPPTTTPPQQKKSKNGIRVFRLPTGSEKHLTWDGKLWNGVLNVPNDEGVCLSEGQPKILQFWYHTKSEQGCFRGLHKMYIKWLKAQNPTTENPVA